MKIDLIENPRYSVDFKTFVPQEKRGIEQKFHPLFLLAKRVYLFYHGLKSVFFTFDYHSFKEDFLAAHEIFWNRVHSSTSFFCLFLIPFELMYWTLALELHVIILLFLSVVVCLLDNSSLFDHLFFNVEEKQPLLDFKRWASPGINPLHIQEKIEQMDVYLEMSKVPKEVKLTDLLSFFEKINFTDRHSPAYLRLDRKDGQERYSKEELKKHLNTFIKNVNDRVPRLGTPPARNPQAVALFYQAIEDLVRFTLHIINTDLNQFLEEHPIPLNEGESVSREFRNRLENRARFIVDLALAGPHCGGRYLGQALESYQMACCRNPIARSLQQTLLQILGCERKKIMDREIARLYGRVENNVHGYTYYMEQIGRLFNVPGTGHAMEPLSPLVVSDPCYIEKAALAFVKLYSEDCIINAVQNEIKTSQLFREQVLDWIKEQVFKNGGWRPKQFPSTKEVVFRMKKVLAEKETLPGALVYEMQLIMDILNLRGATVHVLKKKVPFPDLNQGWSDCVTELFALDEVKKLVCYYYPKFNRLSQMKQQHALCQKMKQGALGETLKDAYMKGGPIRLDKKWMEWLIELQKVQKMQLILALPEETLLRIIRGKAPLKESVDAYLQRLLQGEFLNALLKKYRLDNLDKEGLHPILIEWLLDFHQIFIPREVVLNKKASFCFAKDPLDPILKKNIAR